jgi:hypothetical protein
VCDAGVGEELHLFFCCAHEEEAGGVEQLESMLASVLSFPQLFHLGPQQIARPGSASLSGKTYKAGQILPTIRVAPILTQTPSIPQHETDLDNSCRSSRHQCPPERAVHHRTQHERLWMRTHRISSQ